MGLFNHLLYGARAKKAPLPKGAGWSKGSRLQRFLGTSQEQKGVRTAKRKAYKSQKYKLYNQYRSQKRKQLAALRSQESNLKKWISSGKYNDSELYKKAGIERRFHDDPGDMMKKFEKQKKRTLSQMERAHEKQLKEVRKQIDKQYNTKHNPHAVALAQAQVNEQRRGLFTGSTAA